MGGSRAGLVRRQRVGVAASRNAWDPWVGLWPVALTNCTVLGLILHAVNKATASFDRTVGGGAERQVAFRKLRMGVLECHESRRRLGCRIVGF